MDRLTAARVFVAIHDRGSLAAAAEALDMSRAMVSRHLAQIEHWAGARLYHRTTRRLGLTAAGEATLAHCRKLLDIADEIPGVGDSSREEPRGLLRIACSHPLAQSVLAAGLTRYLQRYPLTKVDLQVLNQAVDLVADRIDFAVRICNEIDPALIARRLATCESVVCASPAYLERSGIPKSIGDLADHNCLTYSYFGRSVWHFDHAGREASVPVGGNLSANDSVVLLQAAVAGAGITLQPVLSARPLIEAGQLVALLGDSRPQALGIFGIYTTRNHRSATLRTMLDFLVDWFAQEVPASAAG